MKKYTIGIISSIIILPSLAFCWSNIQAVWSAPDKIVKLEALASKGQEIVEKLDKAQDIDRERWEKQQIEDNRQWELIMKSLEKKNGTR